VHLNVIWIISSRSVPIFSTINDQEVIYPCFFAFNFASNWWMMLDRDLALLLDLHDLHVMRLKGLWVK
jgi:hypothetical protein